MHDAFGVHVQDHLPLISYKKFYKVCPHIIPWAEIVSVLSLALKVILKE